MDYSNVFKIKEYDYFNKILRYSYFDSKSNILYTNLRTLINAGVEYEKIPFIEFLLYKQYGTNKDDLFIVVGGEKTNIHDISIDCETLNKNGELFTLFTSKDLLDSGITYEEIIKDFKEGHCFVEPPYTSFKAIKLKIPMFVWSQWPMTHTQLSKESQSDRVSEGNGYWLPEGIIEKINNTTEEDIDKINFSQEFIDLQAITSSSDTPAADKIEFILNTFLNGYPQECIQQILKAAGYKREIWSRAPYYFKYKECVVTGWYNDPTTWQHSFLERSVEPNSWKNWTQKETKEVLKVVKDIIEYGKETK